MTGVYTVQDFGPSDLLNSAVEGQRRLVVKAGAKVLFRTITTGTITGTFEIQTYVNYFVQPI